MEYYWNNGSNNTSTTVRGHNGNFIPTPAWDYSSWDLASSTAAARQDWNFYPPPPPPPTAAAFSAAQHQAKTRSAAAITSSPPPPLYYNPDPHMTSLKLGKRHYFGDLTPPPPPPPLVVSGVGPFFATKRGKAAACADAAGGVGTSSAAAAVQRCQVVGCTAALASAKEYHRRHKVCEMHAKAPKVELHGIEQRFCQQCSRLINFPSI